MDLWTVVLEADLRIDARKLGPALAPVLGIPRLEARMLLRKARGILVEDLSDEQARRLVDLLATDGVRARAMRNEELPPLTVPRKVRLVERTDSALGYEWSDEPEGSPRLALPWAEIGVISLGAVALPPFQDFYSNIRFDHVPGLHKLADDPDVRELVRENLILKISAPRPAPERRRRPAPGETIFDELKAKHEGKVKVCCDIIDASHAAWMRVAMDEMVYVHDRGSMKLGDAWGFHLLIDNLRERAPAAFTETSLKFVPGADIKDLLFLQTEEFNRYTFWHAVRRQLGITTCANADSSSPSPAPPEPSTDAGSSSASPQPTPPSISS